MRWWIEFSDSGDEKWVFETKIDKVKNKLNDLFFWNISYIFTIFYFILSMGSLIKLDYTLVNKHLLKILIKYILYRCG